MGRERRTPVFRALVAVVVGIGLRSAAAEPMAAVGAAPGPPANPAWKAHIDPRTGKLTTAPPAPENGPRRAVAPKPAGATAEEGNAAVLRRGTSAGGGLILDLHGRGQNEMRMDVEPGGADHTDCTSGVPGETTH